MGFSTPVLLAGTAVAAGGSASTTLTVGTASPAGVTTAIFVVMSSNGAPGDLPATVNPVIDTQGNAYQLFTSQTSASNSRGQWVYLALNATPLATTDTITCTWAGTATTHGAVAVALPGVAAAAAVDQLFTPAFANSTKPFAVTPGGLGWSTELAIAVEVNRGTSGAPTWSTGWNVLDTVGSGTSFYTSVAYQFTSRLDEPIAASATLGGAVAWSMTGLTLLPAAYMVGSDQIASGTSMTVPVTTPSAVGDTLVLGVGCSGHGVITGVTDTQGNEWQLGPFNVDTGGGAGLQAASSAYAPGATPLGTSDSVLVQISGSDGSKTGFVMAVPGADPTAPLDQQAGTGSSSGSGTPSITTGGLARTVEIAVAIETNAQTGGPIAWAAGWTDATLQNPTRGEYTAIAYMPTGSQAPITPSGTITSTTWSMLVLTFMPEVPATATALTRPVQAVLEPATARGRVWATAGPWFGTGPAPRRRTGPVSLQHRPGAEERYGRILRSGGSAPVTMPPTAGPAIRPPRGPVPNWGRRPAEERYGRVWQNPGAPWTPPPMVDVTQAWTGSRSIGTAFASGAPTSASLDVPIDSDGTGWLIAFCSQTLPDGFLGSTLGVADDVHGCWCPLGAPNGTSSPDGYTRCSIWARPINSASAYTYPQTSHVYVYPTGTAGQPVYPAVIGCTVIEVTGMSPYLGLPAVVTASGNDVSAVSADAGAPISTALQVAVAASDGAPFTAGPGEGWQSLPGIRVDNGDPVMLSTSVAWQMSGAEAPCAWRTGTSLADLSACVAVILVDVAAPPQPNPNWPYTELLFGFGSGANTPLDEIAWTDLTSRLEGATETSATRGKQYQLDQTQAGQVGLTLDNKDSYLSPDNTDSPYYPLMVADTPVMLQMTWEGRTYRQFTGYVARIPQSWNSSTRRGLAQLTIVDSWSLLNAQLNSCQQSEILTSQPAYYWTLGDAAGSAYGQNAAPGNTVPLQVAVSKGGPGGATAAFGADSGLNPGDPDATVFSQTGLTEFGAGYVLACQDGGFPSLSGDGMTIMGWFNPVAPTITEATISNGSAVWHSGSTSFSNGQIVTLFTGPGAGSIPSGFTSGNQYHVVASGGSTWGLATTPGGSAITAGSNGDCDVWTGQPVSENPYLMKGANSAIGNTFALMFGFIQGYTPGGLYLRTYDKETRQATNTLVNDGNWLSAGNTHFALLLTEGTWQVVIEGGASAGFSGECNLPDSIQWLSFLGSADRFYTGGMFNSEVAHLAVFPRLLTADRIAQIVNAGYPTADGGQFPEPANQRIERLLGYGGWTGPRALSTASPMLMAPISDIQGSPGFVSASGQVSASGGQQASQAVSNIVVSDNGMDYVDGHGVQCFISRIDLYGQQPVWFLGENTTSGEYPVEADITFGYDKAQLANVAELTPSTGNGTPVIAQNDDSVEQHSATPYSATVYQDDLNDTIDEANWIVNVKGDPATRLEVGTVNAAANSTNWPFVLGVEPGQIMQGTRRPVTASQPTSVVAIIAQVKRSFNFKAGTASAQVVTDTFPEGEVLIAGDPVYGQLNGLNQLPW
jgi:hypothetical protein